jgi:hypothetical protein
VGWRASSLTSTLSRLLLWHDKLQKAAAYALRKRTPALRQELLYAFFNLSLMVLLIG